MFTCLNVQVHLLLHELIKVLVCNHTLARSLRALCPRTYTYEQTSMRTNMHAHATHAATCMHAKLATTLHNHNRGKHAATRCVAGGSRGCPPRTPGPACERCRVRCSARRSQSSPCGSLSGLWTMRRLWLRYAHAYTRIHGSPSFPARIKKDEKIVSRMHSQAS